ncbi:MAG: hypothetical protein A2Z09_06155 [Nitrospirae bacterium RBG_16_43_8]|nr:MAG: hypothetical protein A2Z09_06155 [Nitrospirae bacterium RBG_16_43_8]
MNIKGEVLKSWPLYTEVFEADKVINIPIAKHHGLAKLTISMKNWMGVMGASWRRPFQGKPPMADASGELLMVGYL